MWLLNLPGTLFQCNLVNIKCIPKAFIIILALFSPLVARVANAQFTKQWDAHYDQVGNTNDIPIAVLTDTKNNTYVLGSTDGLGVLIKYDPNGQQLWTYLVGRETYPVAATPLDFKLDKDGDLYVVLQVNANIGLAKVSGEGTLSWIKTYEYEVNQYSNSKSKVKLLLDDESSVYVAFQSKGDLTVNKYSKDGAFVWTNAWNHPEEIDLLVDARLIDHKIVVIGYYKYLTPSFGYFLASIVTVFDTNGNLLWKDQYVPSGSAFAGSTTPASMNVFNNVLYIAYYNKPVEFSILVRYDFTTGNKLGESYIIVREPLKGLFVGSDNSLYMVSDPSHQVGVQNYSMDGIFIKSMVFSDNASNNRYIHDVFFNVENNTTYILVKADIFLPSNKTLSQILRFDQTGAAIVSNLPFSKGVFEGRVMTLDADRNFSVSGVFKNEAFGDDLITMKVGSVTWESAFVPFNNLIHKPNAICHDLNGNTFVAGELRQVSPASAPFYAESTYYGVIKYNSAGQEEWRFKYEAQGKQGGAEFETSAFSIAANLNGEVIVSGAVLIGSGYDPLNLYSIKLSPDGKILWEAVYNVNRGESAIGYDVTFDESGNAYVLFYLSDNAYAQGKVKLIKYDPQGGLVWDRTVTAWATYLGYATNTEYSYRPKLKFSQNSIYVGNTTFIAKLNENSGLIYFDAIEITRFDAQGNTLFHKILYDCDPCIGGNKTRSLLDFKIDSDGKMYLLVSVNDWGTRQYEVRTVCLTPLGEIAWEKTSPAIADVHDGFLEIGLGDELYTITSSLNGFNYTKMIKSSGVQAWNKSDPVYQYNDSFTIKGQPCYVFVKTDGNPIFMSFTATAANPDDRDLFFSERSGSTGEQINYLTYDGGEGGFRSKRDHLISFYRIPEENSFVVAAQINSRMNYTGELTGPRTFATIKYSAGQIGADLNADFIWSADKIIESNSVEFTDASLGDPKDWQWTFEGGTPQTFSGKKPPAIRYTVPGTYGVSLKIVNAGKNDAEIKANLIHVLQKLKASFNLTSVDHTDGASVLVNSTSTGSVDQWNWSFEGGLPAASTLESPPEVVFRNQGMHSVKLVIRNSIDKDSVSQSVEVKLITGVENQPNSIGIFPNPTADWFEYHPSSSVTTINLYDSYGKIVKSLDVDESKFNIADLPTGVYVLHALSAAKIDAIKIIKK